MASAQNNPGSYLTAARELALHVAAVTDRIDQERELPDELFAELADKGFFRLLVPRSLGGGEIDYLEHLSIVQTFAEVDGSTAWCINQNNVFATVSAKMPESLAREIWGAQRTVVANGPQQMPLLYLSVGDTVSQVGGILAAAVAMPLGWQRSLLSKVLQETRWRIGC